jgi:ATP-dependent helicase/nuclease subunit B
MMISREFLGIERPGLFAAADVLCRDARAGELDLGGHLIVVPGSRAGRTLLAVLVERCEDLGLVLTPPQIITPSELIDVLLPPQRSIAPPLVASLLWQQALRETPADDLRALVPRPPAADDRAAWAGIAAMLARADRELASALATFSEVPTLAARTLPEHEPARYLAAAKVRERYLARVQAARFDDPEASRLARVKAAIETRSVPRARGAGALSGPSVDPRVVLIGITTLTPAARALLLLPGVDVRSLVIGLPDDEAGFDALGCIDPRFWRSRGPGVPDAMLAIVDRAVDQADAALRFLADQSASSVGAPAPHDVVIVAPDPDLAGVLGARARDHAGVALHDAAGVPAMTTSPWQLIRLIAEHLERRSLQSTLALVRHADVDRAFAADLPSLAALDAETTASPQASPPLARGSAGANPPESAFASALSKIDEWLAPFAGPPRPIGEWATPVLLVLKHVYESLRLRDSSTHDRVMTAAITLVRESAESLARLRHADAPVATAAEACRALIDAAAGRSLPAEPGRGAIELVGWLELLLDPAPVAIVTGMNEGLIPAASAVDPLLPEPLRRALGLPMDRDMIARDLYLLRAALAPRRATLVTCARQSQNADPFMPSRVLLIPGLSDAPDALAERLRRFYDPRVSPHDARAHRVAPVAAPARVGAFRVMPRIPDADAIARVPASLSVTSLRTFLRSPYAFFLQHVLRLEEIPEIPDEFNAAGFGSLVHEALGAFGVGPLRDSDDEREIAEAVLDAFRARVWSHFGRDAAAESSDDLRGVPPVVRIQIEAATRRLRVFAVHQAAHRRKGWRIAHAEWSAPGGSVNVRVPVGAERDAEHGAMNASGGASDAEHAQSVIALRGKIDRIDTHENGGVAVWDYKTSDTPKEPKKAHMVAGRWRDLQLPLYRRLVIDSGLVPTDAEISLGYIHIPAGGARDAFECASFSADELRDAERHAGEIVDKIRRAEFWELGESPPDSGTLAWLCGRGFLASSEIGAVEGAP